MPSDISALCAEEQDYLQPYLPPHATRSTGLPISRGEGDSHVQNAAQHDPDRAEARELPFVTLTYACSLDGMISLAPGVRTTLSGPETKSMTHYLRLHHDAILVGRGTAIADKPSLNCRYPDAGLEDQPRPVVVDAKRSWDVLGSPVFKLALEGKAHAPWIFCRSSSDSGSEDFLRAGGKHLVVPEHQHAETSPAGTPSMSWRSILRTLRQQGIRSVMVEGGATVINALLAEPELIDSVIVTIAPTWLGQGGVHACPAPVMEGSQRVNAARLSTTSWRQFGADAVLCGRLGS